MEEEDLALPDTTNSQHHSVESQQLALAQPLHREQSSYITDSMIYVIGSQVFNPYILDLLTFNEVKRLRQVCQSWRTCINFYPRFYSSVLRIDSSWDLAHVGPENQQWNSAPTILNRKIEVFGPRPFVQQYFKEIYWPAISSQLTGLTLAQMKLSCTELTGLITECPLLKELILERLYICVRAETLPNWTSVCENSKWNQCSHAVELKDLPTDPYEPAAQGHGLNTLIIREIVTIPLCTLNLLGSRVQGCLQNFTIGSLKNIHRNRTDFPSHLVHRWCKKVIGQNSAVLQTLNLFISSVKPTVDLRLPETKLGFPALKTAGFTSVFNFKAMLIRSELQKQISELTLGMYDCQGHESTVSDVLSTFSNLKTLKVYSKTALNNLLRRSPEAYNQDFPILENFIFEKFADRKLEKYESIGVFPETLNVLNFKSLVRLPSVILFLNQPNPMGRSALTTFVLDTPTALPLDNDGFQLLLRSLPNLQVLRLWSDLLTDEGITGIGRPEPKQNLRELERLHYLNLNGCSQVSDESLVNSIGYLSKLTFLGLDDSQVSEAGVMLVCKNCLDLQELHLYRTRNVGEGIVSTIRQIRGTITTLHVRFPSPSHV